MRINVEGGLDVRLDGAPLQRIEATLQPSRVALQPADYPGVKPLLAVKPGDSVRAGQPLFHDRGEPGICFASFVSGRVVDIRRGAKRRILEVTVAREGSDSEAFPSHDAHKLAGIDVNELRDTLLRSGLWTALRARPFDRVAAPAVEPRALFVTAIDTRPHAPDPAVVLNDEAGAFAAGVSALSRLASGKTYVCVAPDSEIPVPQSAQIERLEFSGPHPAGLPGTHVHAVGLPVTRDADLWHVGYQDVVAIGHLLLTGKIFARRVIAIAGPGAQRPRLVRTIPGMELSELAPEWQGASGRIASGSPLDGNASARYLGRYHNQATLLPAPSTAGRRTLAGLFRNVLSRRAAIAPAGEQSGMLPLEAFERIWPFRTSPQPLLRALLADDVEGAERYGCLGLAEEDLALCSYLCPGRNDYGAALRRTLTAIEQAG